MRNVTVMIWFLLLAQAYARDMASIHVGNRQSSISKTINKWIDKFLNRAIKASLFHRADLESTTLKKCCLQAKKEAEALLERSKEEARWPRKVTEGSEGVDHANLILDNSGKLQEFYDVDKKVLGQGTFGTVSKCTSKSTGVVRAVKSISKSRIKNEGTFNQEIAVMKMLDHPNIINLYETFRDHCKVHLIMDICNGGELLEKIIELGYFTEVQAAMVMEQILHGVFYMHEMKLIHRDLKPENFLLQVNDPSCSAIESCTLKIIDFGLSCKFSEGVALTSIYGTPFYIAPEVLAGKYDQSADLWSCGVILYVLLCGKPPFYGETQQSIFKKVKQGKVSFNANDWKHVSKDAIDLIKKLLKVSPKDRLTAEQAMNHVWIKNKAPKARSFPLPVSLINNMKSFRSTNKLKKAALHVIASQLDEPKIKGLRDIFVKLDKKGNGVLSFAELRDGFRKAGLTKIPPDFHQIFEEMDTDNSGVIDYTEFLAATLEQKAYIKEDICWSAFRVFDRNRDGKISMQELEQVLSSGSFEEAARANATQRFRELMMEVDSSGDGEIDFSEFMTMMRDQ